MFALMAPPDVRLRHFRFKLGRTFPCFVHGPPGIHHRQPVAHVGDVGQIVAHQDKGQPVLARALRPAIHPQPVYPLKLSDVVSDQCNVETKRVGSDQEVVATDRESGET